MTDPHARSTSPTDATPDASARDATLDRPSFLVGVALDGAGHHPAAWRAGEVTDAGSWFDGTRLVAHARRADDGGVDLATLDDALSLDPGDAATWHGRVDALLACSKLGPLTSRIGLVPSVTATHTEPFNVAKNVATLDWVSSGRGAWQVTVSTDPRELDHFGRRGAEPAEALWDEAADVIEVARRLWDSWEDDAIIRDRPTGRFIDRDKLHYIDFEAPRFSVRGPSIVPRSPQGQPLVVVGADDDHAAAVAASSADVVLIDAADAEDAADRRRRIHEAVRAAGRDPQQVFVLARIEVVLADDDAEAHRRSGALDQLQPWQVRTDRARHVGSAASFAALLAAEWVGAVDGVHVLPAVLDDDLVHIVDGVLPALRARGHVPPLAAPGRLLRHRLGLERPANRYATADRTKEPAR
jgi:alkanesulfonate monooxygenase SsuD/methylene tetrahydromethanopterin reductase-like flavin-dependent oxidoreductase (luciferase family)